MTFPAFSGTEWLIPSNRETYDADDAFASLFEINWSESASAKIATGDVVYLYGTRPIQALTHRCLVSETGVPFDRRVDDDRFWVDRNALNERRVRSWMRLRLLHTFDVRERTLLSLDALVANGLKRAPQGRMRVPVSASILVSGVGSNVRD
ncbi:hypothetical protein [Agromyces sp. NPDC055661]